LLLERSVELLSMLSSRCCSSLGEVLPMLSKLGSWCGEGRVLLPTCMSCLEWKWCCCPAVLGRAESPFWFGPQAVFGLPSKCSCMGKLRRGLCLGFAEMGVSGLGLAIFDTTREPDTNTTRKNRVWVCYNRVRVIIGLTRL
jgi:hypothetical protein